MDLGWVFRRIQRVCQDCPPPNVWEHFLKATVATRDTFAASLLACLLLAPPGEHPNFSSFGSKALRFGTSGAKSIFKKGVGIAVLAVFDDEALH